MEIKKSYDGKISDLEKALADSKKDSADRLAAKEASIRTLLVKGIFDSSAFLKDKTVLPSDVAYASFGRHFEVKEENGELRVVATMNDQHPEGPGRRLRQPSQCRVRPRRKNHPQGRSNRRGPVAARTKRIFP